VQQLVQRKLDISESITEFYNGCISKHTRPKLKDYSNLLHSEIGRFPKTYIVIDALDEYIEADGTRNILLEQLQHLHHKVNVMVTSRHISALESEFDVDTTFKVRASKEDIERCLRSQIHQNHNHTLATYVRKSPELEDEIVVVFVPVLKGCKSHPYWHKSTILCCADVEDRFLMARLYMDSLRKKRNRRDLLEALRNLPTEISATYDEAMRRIADQDDGVYKLAIQVLSWIAHAIRPLTVRELQHALAVRPGDTDIDEDALTDDDTLVSVCNGLATIEQQSNTIRLVHYTTEQYFEQRSGNMFPNFNKTISAACITYLSFDAFSYDSCHNETELLVRLEKFPFVSYAAQAWAEHTQQS
jgi:hypothetical protein